MEGYAHRVSAAALRSRGLVKISGRGPTWRATITDAGRAFLSPAAHDDRAIDSRGRVNERIPTSGDAGAAKEVFPRFRGHLSAWVERSGQGGSSAQIEAAVSTGVPS
jgi:hypothetical protein